MTTFVTIIYVIVALVMVLSILLQSGKGGGLGSALGGGASQSVFGGGGGADFMGKLTQGFAATFMISAMYLAYASAHAGSSFLENEDEGRDGVFESDQEIDYERIGPNPLELDTPAVAQAKQQAASAKVPAQTEAPAAMVEGTANPEAGDPPPAGDGAADLSDNGAEAANDAADPMANGQPTEAIEGGDSPDENRGDSPQGGDDSLTDTASNQGPKDTNQGEAKSDG